MAYTIHRGNVPLIDPSGQYLGPASPEDIIFMVADPLLVARNHDFWVSDIACNSIAQTPNYSNIIGDLKDHINWKLFDEAPLVASIREINYQGVCKYFSDSDRNTECLNRKKIRMAEFLVRDSFPMDLVECFVIKSTKWEHWLNSHIKQNNMNIPVYVNRGCFF